MKNLFLFVFIALILTACGSEPNPLLVYEGTWNALIVQTVSFNEGQEQKTETTTKFEITAGENSLNVNDSNLKVSGNKIIILDTKTSQVMNDITLEILTSGYGTLAENKIEITQIMNSKITQPNEQPTNMYQKIDVILTR